jgi:hypothetical protein
MPQQESVAGSRRINRNRWQVLGFGQYNTTSPGVFFSSHPSGWVRERQYSDRERENQREWPPTWISSVGNSPARRVFQARRGMPPRVLDRLPGWIRLPIVDELLAGVKNPRGAAKPCRWPSAPIYHRDNTLNLTPRDLLFVRTLLG